MGGDRRGASGGEEGGAEEVARYYEKHGYEE